MIIKRDSILGTIIYLFFMFGGYGWIIEDNIKEFEI
jgi:hypothetical protein